MYMALGTVFFLPLLAVSIDLTRVYGLHTELEQAAQAAALAGAKELDFTDAGLVAAAAAATTAVQNLQAQATDKDAPEVAIAAIQFLEALPPAGETNYEDYVTDDATDVRYIRAITETRAIDSPGYRAYLAMWSDTEDIDEAARKATQGDAVAGRTAVACRAMPLMTCNPAEGANEITDDYPNPDTDLYPPGPGGQGFAFLSDFLKVYPEWTRRQLRVKFIGPGTSYANGVFGLLEPMFTSSKGANAIEDELAFGIPGTCIQLDEVQVGSADIKTGQAQTIVDGLNVRLDILAGNWKSEKNNPDYPPAFDVIKGMIPKNSGKVCTPDIIVDDNPNSLSTDDLPDAKKLPQDECFEATTAAELAAYSPKCYALGDQAAETTEFNGNKGFSGRYGNGIWNIVRYFLVNHPTRVDLSDPLNPKINAQDFADILQIEADYLAQFGIPAPATSANPGIPPSRHSVYLWEWQKNFVPYPNGPTSDGTMPMEDGRPQCSQTAPLGPERRSLFLASVNCVKHANVLNSGDRIVPVHEIIEAFMTEPADKTGQGASGDKGAIYVEVKAAMKPGDALNVVLRDLIQLY